MKKEAVAKSKLAQAPFLSNPTALVRKTETETSLQTRAISSCSSSRFSFVPVPYSFYLSCSIFFRCCFCIFYLKTKRELPLGSSRELGRWRFLLVSLKIWRQHWKTEVKNWKLQNFQKFLSWALRVASLFFLLSFLPPSSIFSLLTLKT